MRNEGTLGNGKGTQPVNAPMIPNDETSSLPAPETAASRRAFLIAAGGATGLALASVASAQGSAAPRSRIYGKYKVLACQLKGRWLHPQIWSNFVWEISEAGFILHNYNVCPEDFVGSFVHCDRGELNLDDLLGHMNFMPASGPFGGKTLNGTFKMDDSGQILQLAVAFPGGPTPRAFNAGPGEVYEVWQRVETAWGSDQVSKAWQAAP